MPDPLESALASPAIARIRRNHALEHATIHLLSARYPRQRLIGRSDVSGFVLYGDLPTEAIEQAATEALARLRLGDHRLALHPNCGTSLLTSGLLSGLAVFLGLGAQRSVQRPSDRWLRLPTAILLAVLALLVAQPLGLMLQRRVTTLAEPGATEIRAVRRRSSGPLPSHRIITTG